MAKFVSPLLGYNNNVRHKNRVFHIQTEDSGINHPHIITHLFMDGGRILKSVKTSYAEHVGTEKMNETVRQMMKDQHKAMFIALRDGQFDHLLEGGPAKAPPAKSEAKVPAAETSDADATQRMQAVKPDSAPPASAPEPITAEVAAAKPSAPPPGPENAITEPSIPAPILPPASAPPIEGPFRALTAASPPPTAPLGISAPSPSGSPPESIRETPSAPRVEGTASRPKLPSVRDLTIDFDALDRAAEAAPESSPLFRENDLPPPPANLFAKNTSGAYRAAPGDRRVDPREEPESPGPRPAAKPSPQPSRAPAVARPAPDQRYAPARPAAIFGPSANRPQPASIFSDELISDKSLDEVILSYLAEDLEPPPDGK